MRSILPVVILALLFLISAYAAQTYQADIAAFIGDGVTGLLIYILLAAVTTVLAPLSNLPFIPIASALWGPPIAALASVLGWGLGGMIAFALSRKYGRPLVERFIPTDKLAQVEKRIPKERQFWPIFFLSMVFPTDVLSYTLGLFKEVSWRIYPVAMVLGNIPFAFVFAYTGS
ncbi:MAG TPA: VTT domain-containing protein, partial [Candidatus Paceibacterota bacterium]